MIKLDPKELEGKWLDAAGNCTFQESENSLECGAPVKVKISDGWATFRCTRGHDEEDSVSWVYFAKSIVFQGKEYLPFEKRSNHAHCVNCGKIIYELPLILWGPRAPRVVKWELNFCWGCVDKLGFNFGVSK